MKKMNEQLLLIIIMCVLVLIWLIPLYSSIVTSLKTQDQIWTSGPWVLPKPVYLGNFVRAWNLGIRKYLLNSFIIVIPSVVGALFLASLASHALSQYEFRGNQLILMLFLGFNFMPFQIFLIPLYRLTNFLGIYDTYLAVILFHISFQTGFCTFFLSRFMRTIPSEIIDAARMDGISEFVLYWRIILPLSLPAVTALGALVFTWVWNDLIIATVLLRTDTLKPITTGIAGLRGQYVSPYGILNAAALIALIPTVIVFLCLQKHFVRGLTMGAIK